MRGGFCAIAMLGVLLLAGCRSAPITGRKQLLLVPESQEVALGVTAFQDVTGKEKPSQNPQYTQLVSRVGNRIAAAANKPDYQWEFRVIDSPTQNAFCLPGGKVAVYEGIIPVCATEAGLAVVMSHEVAHALARHGGERMSQNYAVDGVKQVLSYATQSQDATRREAILKAYGLGTQYGVLLPYSREHESEADNIGIMLMARSGYDPREAPRFWQRFGQAKQGEQPMEFMSTHPSDARRANDLAQLVPEALTLYEAAPDKHGLGDPIDPPAAAPSAVPSAPPPAGIPPPPQPMSFAPSALGPTNPYGPGGGFSPSQAPPLMQPQSLPGGFN